MAVYLVLIYVDIPSTDCDSWILRKSFLQYSSETLLRLSSTSSAMSPSCIFHRILFSSFFPNSLVLGWRPRLRDFLQRRWWRSCSFQSLCRRLFGRLQSALRPSSRRGTDQICRREENRRRCLAGPEGNRAIIVYSEVAVVLIQMAIDWCGEFISG